jgi:hypothetical protein
MLTLRDAIPRMRFHWTIDDQHFADQVGGEVGDLAAEHPHAILLAHPLMSFLQLLKQCEIRGERCHDGGVGRRSLISVIVGRERFAEATRAGWQPRLLPQSGPSVTLA